MPNDLAAATPWHGPLEGRLRAVNRDRLTEPNDAARRMPGKDEACAPGATFVTTLPLAAAG